jgi:hypothetical protein
VKKKEQIIISVGAMVGGCLLFGVARSISTLGDVVPVLCVIFGLGFVVGGFISLILALKRPALKDK